MRYCFTNFNPADHESINKLRNSGKFVYGIRDAEGVHFTIEPHVVVNNIGHCVTDTDLSPFMHRANCGRVIWIDDNEFFALHPIEDKTILEVT